MNHALLWISGFLAGGVVMSLVARKRYWREYRGRMAVEHGDTPGNRVTLHFDEGRKVRGNGNGGPTASKPPLGPRES